MPLKTQSETLGDPQTQPWQAPITKPFDTPSNVKGQKAIQNHSVINGCGSSFSNLINKMWNETKVQ